MEKIRLFDPTTQFQTKSGALNVAGKLRIYVESTDDIANIYGDDGEILTQPLLLDSNGRASGLFVDSGRSYRLEVYDRNDSLLFTIRRLEPNASGTIVIPPTVFIKGTPDEIDVEDSVTEKIRTYTVSLSAKVTGKIAENREAIVKETEARKDSDDELRKMIDNIVTCDNDKVAVESGAVAGFLKDVLVSASDMLTLVPSGNRLIVTFNLILPSDVVRDSAYTHIDAATANPLMDGTSAVGISTKYAREDHVHSTDTSREDKANKTTVVLGTSDSKYPTDKAVAEFVNSSIATNTANYISNNGEPFTSVEQLEAYSGPVTNNDYAFVTGTDSEGNTYYDRYKATVSGETVTWALEYRLNNSSFTAAQWSAINSGITSALVDKIHTHSNKDVLDGITSDKVNSWDGKEDAFEILPTIKGGTGTSAKTKSGLTSSLINSLSIASNTPSDGDFYVSQHASGGTKTTSYHRRPVSALWNYIKGKISSVLRLTASDYAGKAATAGTADKAVADESGNNIANTYATKTELSAKQNSLTAGDNITISADNVISADKQIIYANYGTTTYNEVKNAILNGFDVIVRKDGNIYHSMWLGVNNTGDIYFGSVDSSGPSIRQVILKTNNSWSKSETTLQGKLTFDTKPTAGSTNPVTSEGIKTAIDTVNAKGLTIKEISGENVICFE